MKRRRLEREALIPFLFPLVADSFPGEGKRGGGGGGGGRGEKRGTFRAFE